MQKKFESFDLQHIPRGGNTHADSLVTLATSSTQNLPRVILVEDLGKPLGEKGNMIYVPHVRVGSSWMDPIIQFLSKDVLPKDKKRYARRLLSSGYSRTRNCTNDLSRDHTYYAYILKHQNYFLRNYNRSRLVGGRGRGITGGCVLGASFELPPLFLLASRPFKPGHFF